MIDEDKTRFQYTWLAEINSNWITIFKEELNGDLEEIIVGYFKPVVDERTIAEANLMAAAPEMFRAISSVIEEYNQGKMKRTPAVSSCIRARIKAISGENYGGM